MVVKPAMVSKNASDTLSSVPVNRNGNMPKAENTIQMVAVRMSPSRLRMVLLLGLMPNVMATPAVSVMSTASPNATHVPVSP